MDGGTSISDLPTDPTGGGNTTNNISLSAIENNNKNTVQHQPEIPMSLDQSTINQIVSGIQQLKTTQLPSRDIPTTTHNVTIDEEIRPNYVPASKNKDDFLKDYDDNDEIIRGYEEEQKYKSSLDTMYDELQIPLLIGVMYFLFQLPFFRSQLYAYLPVLFTNDGNINLYGYLFTSILFALFYFMLAKLTSYAGRC
jgi:hypothetical protein